MVACGVRLDKREVKQLVERLLASVSAGASLQRGMQIEFTPSFAPRERAYVWAVLKRTPGAALD